MINCKHFYYYLNINLNDLCCCFFLLCLPIDVSSFVHPFSVVLFLSLVNYGYMWFQIQIVESSLNYLLIVTLFLLLFFCCLFIVKVRVMGTCVGT